MAENVNIYVTVAGFGCLVSGIVALYKFLWRAYFDPASDMHIARDLALISLSGLVIIGAGFLMLYGMGQFS